MTLNINMEKDELLENYFTERNLSQSAQVIYRRCVRYFENITGTSIIDCLNIADTEEENNIRWKNTHLRKWLINYRKWCYENYKKSTAHLYYVTIIGLFRHYEITVETLPRFSTKQTQPSIPINPDLMVDRDILKLCIETNSNKLFKACVLLMSSSGISRIDTVNLQIKDYLNACEANNLKDIDTETVPTWWLTRQKTGQSYYTFSSPESTQAIQNYLLTREDITPDKPLFDIHPRWLSYLFKETNDKLGLGKNGPYSRFAPHMLRRYHATQLISAGVSEGKVDLLQGRKPHSIAYNSYIKVKPSELKEEYIRALPFIVVDDVNKVKSELDIVKEENNVLKSREEQLFDIVARIERLENGL